MTPKSAFTDDEWELITITPIAVGVAMAKAGRSGLIGSVRETKALVDTVSDAGHTHALNEVIKAVVADHRYPKNELIGAAIATALEHNLERAIQTAPNSAEALAIAATEDCEAVSAILDRKAESDEAADYRRWILDIAQNVAETATEDGVVVSPPEADLIRRITGVFGL